MIVHLSLPEWMHCIPDVRFLKWLLEREEVDEEYKRLLREIVVGG